MSTIRQDNIGEPQEVEQVIPHGWVDNSSSYQTTTTRVDHFSYEDELIDPEQPELGTESVLRTEETNYDMYIHKPDKILE